MSQISNWNSNRKCIAANREIAPQGRLRNQSKVLNEARLICKSTNLFADATEQK